MTTPSGTGRRPSPPNIQTIPVHTPEGDKIRAAFTRGLGMNTKLRPMLAAKIETEEELEKLRYPVICSPKIDGIRCLIHPELGAVTRSFKPIPNIYLRDFIKRRLRELSYLDGELTLGDWTAGDVFNKTTSAVMTHGGEPKDITFWVFDEWSCPQFSYRDRATLLHDRVATFIRVWRPHLEHFERSLQVKTIHMEQWTAPTPKSVLEAEEVYLKLGFEGIMIRDPNRPYKFGRSTLKEQALVKWKRMEDAEAVIIGFEPLWRNENPQTRDNFGLARRSDHQEGKRETETLGNLRCQGDFNGQVCEFGVGSGFDQALRGEIWRNRPAYLGQTISYKFQRVGSLEAPRFPIFKGFRPQE